MLSYAKGGNPAGVRGFHVTHSKNYLEEASRNAERLRAAVDLYFSQQGQGFNAHLLMRAQAEALAHMNAKSDLELLQEGMTRADIPHRIFGVYFS